MKTRIHHASWVVVIFCLWGVASQAQAAADHKKTLFTRDTTYEEYLHIHSNPDEEKITPVRVLRWMMGMRGQDVMPRTSTEFQPVVDADQHEVRAVAAVAYKFF